MLTKSAEIADAPAPFWRRLRDAPAEQHPYWAVPLLRSAETRGEPSGLGRWGCRVGRCRRWNRVRVRRWCRLRRGRRWNGLGHVFFPLRLAGEIGSSQAAVPISTAAALFQRSEALARSRTRARPPPGREETKYWPRGSNASCSVAS